jgi:hypothetical protein
VTIERRIKSAEGWHPSRYKRAKDRLRHWWAVFSIAPCPGCGEPLTKTDAWGRSGTKRFPGIYHEDCLFAEADRLGWVLIKTPIDGPPENAGLRIPAKS